MILKKCKKLQLQEGIREISMNYITRKKHERCSNRNSKLLMKFLILCDNF